MGTFESITLPLEVDVYVTTKTSPVLGIYSEIDCTGWLFDRAILVSSLSELFRYNTYTGSIEYKLTTGTVMTDWQSGSIGSLSYLNLNKLSKPLIHIGNFSLSSSIRTLYSDFSYTSLISHLNNDVDGNNTHTLPSDASLDTVNIYSFKRDNNLISQIIDSFNYVESFTADSYLKEFTYADNVITLNGNYIKKHGISPETIDWTDLKNFGYTVGNGNGSYRDFYCSHFPVIPDTIRAFILHPDGTTVEEWTFVDSFDFSLSTDTVLVLNKDLGVISCGGYQPDALVLKESLTSSDIEITFYTTKDIAAYPTQGIIYIGSETIAYTSRSQTTLLNCTRGYLGSEAATHSIGDLMTYEVRGQSIPDNYGLYIYYESTMRVDAEVSDSTIRTGEADCRPSKNSTAAKIVQISSKLRDLDSLVLESDKPSLGGGSYGPVYFGNDISKLTVTAYDVVGNTVDDIAITLEILDPQVGLLDGESLEITKYSNSDGKIFVYYNAPIDSDDFSTKFDSIETSGSTTIFEIEDIDPTVELEDVFIYQILKNDPSYGTSGVRFPVTSITETSTREGVDFEATLSANLDDSYDGGIAYFISDDNTVYTRTIVQAYGTELYCSGDALTVAIDYVWLVTANDVEWDSTLLNGVPVILYVYDTESEHPLTGEAGAYAPMKPTSITDGSITYNYLLPTPEPEDRSSNLGGYIIIAPLTVGLRAKATDPYSGQLIYSNTIYLNVKLPVYLTGVNNSGTLPVPKGFNFILSEENTGNGLGLGNFITINKRGGLFGLQLRFTS